MLNGWHQGQRTGSGTVVWKSRERLVAGEIDYEEFVLILIGLLILLPVVGAQLGLNLDVISAILRTLIGYVISALLFITGNA